MNPGQGWRLKRRKMAPIQSGYGGDIVCYMQGHSDAWGQGRRLPGVFCQGLFFFFKLVTYCVYWVDTLNMLS